ncbi:MAG: DUF2752 domain-containing protein [Actinomycetota bacterium]|nr:DUF2752 domain-containing protein [Actinomycetota bacterium]
MIAAVTRASSRVPVVATGIGVAAAAVVLRVGDPAAGGFPRCPFHAATGLYCPGCGSQRGLHALLTGDIPAAFGYNAFMVLALPFLFYVYVSWAARSFDGPALPTMHPPVWFLKVLPPLVMAFWVTRNLPFGHALAP